MISEFTAKKAAQQLIEKSDYASRHSKLVAFLLEKREWGKSFSFDSYFNELEKYQDQSIEDFAVSLRVFRNRHLLRLLLRTILNLTTIEETMRTWSDMADAIIMTTLGRIEREYRPIYGVPSNADGHRVELYPVALGKLGGRELNFSSDIDLLFVYAESGQTDGPQVISNEEYFTKLIKKFISLLQHVSSDGFVFRVDLRLRPFGTSGALAMSLAATEAYYQEQGRDWERYAMVKARLIGHDAIALVRRCLTPFVYRKYVDFSVIESLRSMKMLIERELILNPSQNDVKKGYGGIREIEFIIQCFQLIRGGRLPGLQVTGSMDALKILGEEKLLKWSHLLREAYLFYRALENALQTFGDRQTHTLPEHNDARDYLLLMLRLESYAVIEKKIASYQRIVRRLFCHMLGEKKLSLGDDEQWTASLLMQVWRGHIEAMMAVSALKSQSVPEPEACYRLICAFRHSPRCRRLSQASRLRLDHFMTRFLFSLSKFKPCLRVLESMFQLFDVIVNRSTYFALLTENDYALYRVMYWFQKSALIANWVISNPFLLDTLIFLDVHWKPLSSSALHLALAKYLEQAENEEALGELLREFKLIYWLHIACAELSGQCTAIQASKFLSELAEVIVQSVVNLSTLSLIDKYPEIRHIQSQFFLLAYGKLGSREMNYDSDLDLVFLHDVSPTQEYLIFRLTQKILYILTIRLRAGILYPTDTRLRPSGASGLLVSRVSAFLEYQHSHAWIWEHQALVKARVLLGHRDFKRTFFDLKKNILMRYVEKKGVMEEIRDMRLKIQQHHAYDAVKYRAGGLLDLEFLIQYKILMAPCSVWMRVTHTMLQLMHLKALGIWSSQEYADLAQAYAAFHQALHQQAMGVTVSAVDESHYRCVRRIYETNFPMRS
jgi:[glutamine synthetase] adenylyltransferase / [glutamine synthetase]-adenylyl-L-tyrosine phosphorylase